MNFYIWTNLCHHRQIKIWNILEPILEVSHMSPPSQYSSAPPPPPQGSHYSNLYHHR